MSVKDRGPSLPETGGATKDSPAQGDYYVLSYNNDDI